MDELNELSIEYGDLDIESYFELMDISDEQKEKRKDAASDFWDALLFLFALIRVSIEYADFDYNYILTQFQNRYSEMVSEYARLDSYIEQYIDTFTHNTLNTTIERLNLTSENDYWTSDKRALGIALNEANSVLNYEELQQAIDKGYTHKQWRAEIDRKTRDEHREMNGKTIPIDQYFHFSDCEMMMPHDEVNGTAEQLVNCRCALKYSK